jgi:hypothetical protein
MVANIFRSSFILFMKTDVILFASSRLMLPGKLDVKSQLSVISVTMDMEMMKIHII